MIDIYCKKRKCPICDSDMIGDTNSTFINVLTCKNKCYTILQLDIGYKNNTSTSMITIFGKLISIDADDKFHIKFRKKREVKRNIQYWKEHDRYVMRLLADG